MQAFFADIFAQDWLIRFDWGIFAFFEKLWNPVLDVIMTLITYLGDDGIFWLVLALGLLISRKTRKYGIYIIMGIGFAAALNNGLLKHMAERPRPFNFTWPEDCPYVYPDVVARPESWSFPSGHTSSSFGAALPLLLRAKKRFGIPAIVLAFLIGASRIYVHVHYPTDVIVGAIVGIIAGLIATLVLDKLLMPKVFPWVNAKLKRNILPTLEPKHSKLEEEAA